MTETNRQVRLRARPEGIPEARHFEDPAMAAAQGMGRAG